MAAMKRIYRQGDVLIIPTKAKTITGYKPLAPEDDGSVVLAHGEVTGHKHQLRDPGVCLLARDGFSDRLLTIDMGARLVHEEHGTIDLPAGCYVVRIQKEYSPEALRNVQD